MTDEAFSEKKAALEALLFIHGEPLTMKKIAAVLGVEKDELAAALLSLDADIEASGRGLALIVDGSLQDIFQNNSWGDRKVQLATKPEFGRILESFVKEELREDLTPASLETLSLIAYLGPITRSRLEYLRGVNSSFILRNLLLRGLIERVPDPERPGSFLYRATLDFIKQLGISSSEELPEFATFKSLSNFEERPSEEVPKAPEGSAEVPTPASS
ncbi:MAG: SMC-Scp complex subunit ScpB [Patescibacteria group bacterium]